MITALSIRNLAVVEDVEINFDQGMTSLTGETGAGKSMLVDALSLVLGDRADSKMVRQGSERAEISASFAIENNPPLLHWLIEEELDDDGQCELRRTINKEGRSRAYINGRAVQLAQLREISIRSIDIHGQHAHQSLIRSETQRELLDTVAGTESLLNELAVQYQQLKATEKALDTIKQKSQDQTARRDLLDYQVTELQALNLNQEYVEQLIQEHKQRNNASQLIEAAQLAQYQLFEQEQGAAYALISQALNEITVHQDIEPQFANLLETLNSAVIQLDEVSNELRHYLDNTDNDPQRLQQVEIELASLHDQARKHHIEIEQLPGHFEQLQQELASLENIEVHTEELHQQFNQQMAACHDLCDKISKKRQQTAKPLSKKISVSVQELSMPTAQVEFVVSPIANDNFNETGSDHIQLLVTTNPGQPAGELSKVASGGELARISLAIQVVTASSRSVPTLVFDEVDVGIGGGIAEIVGKHLRKLAENRQVICITHLPQVAAQAHQQLQVSKTNLKESTHINITALDKKQRIEEIARMLGGVTLTEKTRLHAEEMLVKSAC